MKFLLQASLILLTVMGGTAGVEASTDAASVKEPSVQTVSDADAQAADEPQITLYMTDWCGYCRKTERLLESLDVTYKAVDIEKVPGARAEKQRFQPRCGVPVTVIGEQSVCGFSEGKIRQMVAKLKNETKDAAAAASVAER